MTDLTEPTHTTAAPGTGGATGTAATPSTDRSASVASSAATEAKAVASEAASEAKDVLTDARQQLRQQAEEQSAKVASVIGELGDQLRRMAAAGESGPARDIVSGVADQAEQMSQRLRNGGLDRTLEDARRVARNRPGMFLAGAALAGFAAARVVRMADTERVKQAISGSDDTPGQGWDTTEAASPVPSSFARPTPTSAPALGPTEQLR
jgi:hypothetical protein